MLSDYERDECDRVINEDKRSPIVSVRLPVEMRDAADKAAKVRGLNRASVIKLALAEWLARNGG